MGTSNVYTVRTENDSAADLATTTAEAILNVKNISSQTTEITALYTDYNAARLKGAYGVTSVEAADDRADDAIRLGGLVLLAGAAYFLTR